MRSMRGLVAGVVAAAVVLSACRATTSTPPPHVGAQANGGQAAAYATSILDRATLPAGAEPATRLPVSLIDGAGVPAIPALVDVHRSFLLSRPVNLGRFVETHAPRGATSAGNLREVGTNHLYEAGYSLSLPTTNRHAAYVLLDYSVGAAASGQGELRVDVHVEWAHIRTVDLPTGVVTLTGYRRLTYANPSSGPVTVVLTSSQAGELRGELAGLANGAPGGMCPESLKLFVISVATRRGVLPTWIATAKSCLGEIDVVNHHQSTVVLDDACSLRRLVGAWLPKISTEWRQAMFWNCPPGA
jgi:hypothetical protein